MPELVILVDLNCEKLIVPAALFLGVFRAYRSFLACCYARISIFTARDDGRYVFLLAGYVGKFL